MKLLKQVIIMTIPGKFFGFQKLFIKTNISIAILLFIFTSNILAQSTNQNSPTPLITNEIQGRINARDIGDSRLTAYYFAFEGERGDVFINVVTDNLNGDIDIFTADNFQPRTKITVYADSSNTETGRIVYMRKPEKLIMRIQGRTPNDDPATFYIKFAGSFKALAPSGLAETVETPKVEVERTGTVRVNSVGTIIEEPKPVEIDEKAEAKLGRDRVTVEENTEKSAIPETFDPRRKTNLPEDTSILNPRVVVTENTNESEETSSDVTVTIEEKTKDNSTIVRIERSEDSDDEDATAKLEEEKKILAKLDLKIRLKNGTRYQKAMNEVISINVIKNILTIVTSDGKIQEFSIFEVEKMSID